MITTRTYHGSITSGYVDTVVRLPPVCESDGVCWKEERIRLAEEREEDLARRREVWI